MEQHSNAKDVHVYSAHNQVVQKIPGRKSLHEATGPGVSVHPLRGGHAVPLTVGEHDPQSDQVNEGALHERHDMDIPVELGTTREVWIETGEERSRQSR